MSSNVQAPVEADHPNTEYAPLVQDTEYPTEPDANALPEMYPVEEPLDGEKRSSPQIPDPLGEVEAALQAMDEEERVMDERLQAYSEVVRLRKELRIVKDDAETARAQLETLRAGGEFDVPSVADIEAAEEAASQSAVQEEWTAACRRFPCRPEDVTERAKVRINNLNQRFAAVQERFCSAANAATRLQSSQDAELNANTDARDRRKEELNANIEEEMAKLAEKRARLKQVEREQWFHIKRGTHVKQLQTPSRVRQETTQHRVYLSEAKEVGTLCQLSDERAELTEQVRQCRRVLEDNKRSHAEEQQKLRKKLEEIEESGKDAREMRELFEKENDELRKVKQDIQRVLQYVRVRNREVFE